MTKEKIRQKAIESAKAITQGCCKPCKECEYGEYFLRSVDVPCLTVNGYEHGFADGVEEGKQIALAHLTESLKHEIDYLNENGGGIGDLYFWLERMKEGGANG